MAKVASRIRSRDSSPCWWRRAVLRGTKAPSVGDESNSAHKSPPRDADSAWTSDGKNLPGSACGPHHMLVPSSVFPVVITLWTVVIVTEDEIASAQGSGA